MPVSNFPSMSNPLSGLHNIIEPSSANWWPLPPIYYLLVFSFIAMITLAVFLLKKHKKQQQKLNALLQQLSKLKGNKASSIELNQLLKIASLNYFPRSSVASLHSKQWLEFLQKVAENPLQGTFQDEAMFIKQLYTQASPATELDFKEAEKWIKQLPSQIKKEAYHV